MTRGVDERNPDDTKPGVGLIRAAGGKRCIERARE
jgi:hypothetical protein